MICFQLTGSGFRNTDRRIQGGQVSLGVLIVEDENEFRQYLIDAIPWKRYDLRIVGTVDDVSSARTILQTVRIDLVLLDITLQRSDGLELVDELKKLRPAPRIIVITGHSEFETVRRALRLGVDDYLLKPFARQELLMSVISNREHLLERLKEYRQEATLQETMVEGWLYRLLRADSENESGHVRELLDRHHISIPGAPRILICTEITYQDQTAVHRRWVRHVSAMWKLTTAQSDALSWSGLDDRIYVLFGGTEASEVGWDAQDMAKEFVGQAHKRLPFRLRVGISCVDSGGTPLPTLHHQALAALVSNSKESPVTVWSEELEITLPGMDNTTNRWHRAARNFIEDYHHDPTLDVQTVASHLGISTEYLRQIFQQSEGISCINAIANRRIDHARVLLRSESIPIGEIAERSGFRDPAYFSRQFRRIAGVSPREYRLL